MEASPISYKTPWTMYAFSMSSSLQIALSSFIETQNNQIQILSVDESSQSLNLVAEAAHQYPPSKIMWNPLRGNCLASAGDILRIWNCSGSSLDLKSSLNTGDQEDFPPPLTSIDWNPCQDFKIASASVNTTCAVWDINKESMITQLIAHDKEVYDISFAADANVFATAGGDGSVRQFDLRDLRSSSILYERQDITPCLRLSWNKIESNYIAVIMMDLPNIIIIDMRSTSKPVSQLVGHMACVNSLAWSPVNSHALLSGGDDQQTLLWTVPSEESSLVYSSDIEVTYVQWNVPEVIGLAHSRELKVLRV